MTFTVIAVVAFALAVLLYFYKAAKKTVPWLMLIASAGITAGAIGSVLDRIASSATAGTTSATGRLFGTAVSFVLAAMVTAYLWIHMQPKGGRPPSRVTPFVALAYFPILAAAGGVFASLASTGQTTLADVTTGVSAFFMSMFGGGS